MHVEKHPTLKNDKDIPFFPMPATCVDNNTEDRLDILILSKNLSSLPVYDF